MAAAGCWWFQTGQPDGIEEEGNKLDPDDGNSTLCAACRLPIFSTPVITIGGGGRVMMHDQCANHHLFPEKFEGYHWRWRRELILHQQQYSTSTSLTNNNNNNNNNIVCSRCGSICGTSFYKCPYYGIDFQLDLACALTINWILHRSHRHRLTVIKGKSLSSLFCGVCETQHHDQQQQPPTTTTWQVWYACIPCDFWIHQDCALLPNAIKIDDHNQHPLLLKYEFKPSYICAICDDKGCNKLFRPYDLGSYECYPCGYTLHIKCAVYSDPAGHHVSFKPVKIRDAQVPGLLRLPMPNETTSVMAHILTKTTDGTSSSGGDHQMISDGGKLLLFEDKKIHDHPLILHDHDDPSFAAGGVARICNACVQLISLSDPFYSCTTYNNNNNNELFAAGGGCKDFFLHKFCAHLPTTLPTRHWSRRIEYCHPLTLLSNPHFPFNIFVCRVCKRKCNGFAYACEKDEFIVDVFCAFMITSITHEGHANSHILRVCNNWFGTCICCGGYTDSWSDIDFGLCGFGYQCDNCRNFSIHIKCALLPNTVTHKFDRHPLKLITTTQTRLITDDDHQLVRGEQMFCEICENDIDNRRRWYYGCKECDNYFHTGCIPCLDGLSKIKFGFTVRVRCHDCPLTCVRALSIDGYRCQCGCSERTIITESDKIAFECSECYFKIRKQCVVREINDIDQS